MRGGATFLLVVVALAGCGGDVTASSEEPSFLGESCAIEIGIDRGASPAETAAFRERLEATAHVRRVEVIPRERFIELFERALRDEGYQGKEYERLAKRAETYAGPTLVAMPDENGNVPQIIVALQELPAAVTSVFDRPSCESG